MANCSTLAYCSDQACLFFLDVSRSYILFACSGCAYRVSVPDRDLLLQSLVRLLTPITLAYFWTEFWLMFLHFGGIGWSTNRWLWMVVMDGLLVDGIKPFFLNRVCLLLSFPDVHKNKFFFA